MKSILSIVKEIYPSKIDELWVYEAYAIHKPFMFLMQNPGFGAKREKEEIKEIRKKYKDEKVRFAKEVECHHQHLIQWFEGRSSKKKFGAGFKKIFIEALSPQFFGDNFLDKFYITDFIKVQSKTNELSEEDFRGWYKVLDKEIREVKPGLVISFGSRVWKALKEASIGLKPIHADLNEWELLSLTDIHGYAFRSAKYKCFLIPLVHMSNQPFQNTLRNSYFDYLKEGLADIKLAETNLKS